MKFSAKLYLIVSNNILVSACMINSGDYIVQVTLQFCSEQVKVVGILDLLLQLHALQWNKSRDVPAIKGEALRYVAIHLLL